MKTIEAMKQALSIVSRTPTYTAPVILALQEAIAAEEAQWLEPVAWIYECGTIGGYDYRLEKERITEGHYADSAMWIETPLYRHLAPTKPALSTEREALVAQSDMWTSNKTASDEDFQAIKALLQEMADMLASDAQEIAPHGWMIEGSSQVLRGEHAEFDAKSEAKRCGGTCQAYPVYLKP